MIGGAIRADASPGKVIMKNTGYGKQTNAAPNGVSLVSISPLRRSLAGKLIDDCPDYCS